MPPWRARRRPSCSASRPGPGRAATRKPPVACSWTRSARRGSSRPRRDGATSALGLTSVQLFGHIRGRCRRYLHEALLVAEDLHSADQADHRPGPGAGADANEEERAAAFAAEAQDRPARSTTPASRPMLSTRPCSPRGGRTTSPSASRLGRQDRGEQRPPGGSRAAVSTAHVWRLVTAWETLDILAVRRQLRALDLLAEETGSARATF